MGLAFSGETIVLELSAPDAPDITLVDLPGLVRDDAPRAKPKIADYAFTTIVPNLGVWHTDDGVAGDGLVLADIPGAQRVDGAARWRCQVARGGRNSSPSTATLRVSRLASPSR